MYQKGFQYDEERNLDNKDSLQGPLPAHNFLEPCEALLGLFVTAGFHFGRGSTMYDSRSKN
jgi:hypothetical protein